MNSGIGMQSVWIDRSHICTLFGCSYQHNLSAMVQCFSLTTKQSQPAYKPQKQPAEQGDGLRRPYIQCCHQ
jgi:hypothetical protein